MATPQPTPTTASPMKNFLQNKAVPGLFQKLVFDKRLTLKSTDSPYYSVRCFDRTPESANPLEKELKEPFDDAEDPRPYALVDLKVEGKDPATRKSILDELAFLKRLRLVQKKDDNTYYVSSLAAFLYKKVDGLFSKDDKDMKPLITLLVTYTLPGYYWQAYYAKPYLPQEISMTGKLRSALTDIRDLWAELRGFFDRPIQENAETNVEG
jgi:hypothetical protein